MPRVFLRRDANLYFQRSTIQWHTCDQSRVGNLNLDDVLLFLFGLDQDQTLARDLTRPFLARVGGTGPHLLPVTTASSLALRAINHFAGHEQLKASGQLNY